MMGRHREGLGKEVGRDQTRVGAPGNLVGSKRVNRVKCCKVEQQRL